MKTERRRQPLLHVIGASLAAALLVSCGGTPKPAFAPSSGGAVDVSSAQVTLPLPQPRPEIPTGPGEQQTFPSSDLIGLTLPELRRKLGGGLLIGDVGPDLIVSQGEGAPALSFYAMSDVLADPWAQQRWRLGYRGNPPTGEWTSCLASFGPDVSLMNGSALNALFVFRGELLMEIRHPLASTLPPNERVQPRPGETLAQANERAAAERRKQPVFHPFLSQPGQLPLADGAAFLTRWSGARVTPNEQITTRCSMERPRPRDPKAPAMKQAASFNVPQALMLAPFAVLMPSINGDRTSAMKEGPQAEAQLALNQPVPGGAEAFAKKNKRAYWYPGQHGYGVLAFDFGMVPNNNLDARGGMAFAGVVNDHVVWMAKEMGEGAAFGFLANQLCLDADNVAGRARKGCNEYGLFNPVR